MTVVSDYTALLRYLDSDSSRWNGNTVVGTPTVVTYSFVEALDLPPLTGAGAYDPYGATAYWSYSTTQREYFRDVLAQYEAVAGVTFVEVDGPAMINAMGADVSGVGGWAAYASTYDDHTGSGYFVNAYSNFAPGAYGYQVILHELGHALGLKHPHDGGDLTLDPAEDTQDNTVMTYNIGYPYATDLGPLDILALQDIYGAAAGFDGWNIFANVYDRVIIEATVASEIIIAGDKWSILRGYGGDDLMLGRQSEDVMFGHNGDDTLRGSDGNDTLRGGNDDDLMFGDDESGYWGDNDLLNGGAGNDTMYGDGGDDKLYAYDGDDSLEGGYGNDTLQGGDGADTIYGGDGADRFKGGAGADVFVFDVYDLNERDVILDFEQGVDVIDFSAFAQSSGLQFYHLDFNDIGGVYTQVTVNGWGMDLLLKGIGVGDVTAADFDFTY